jgi:hypothetical protein
MPLPQPPDGNAMPPPRGNPLQQSSSRSRRPSKKMTKDKATGRLIRLIEQAGNGRTIHIKEVKALLDVGADLNAQGKDGMTLLHRAVEAKDTELVKLLLAYNANLNLTNNAGLTPLDFGQKIGDKKIIDILREQGAKTKKELEAEKKKKKQFNNSWGGHKSKVPNLGKGSGLSSGSGSESGAIDVDLEKSDSKENLFDGPKMLQIDSRRWQNNYRMDKVVQDVIPQQSVRASRGRRKGLEPASKQIEENVPINPGIIIFRIGLSVGEITAMRLLKSSNRKNFILPSGTGKVFISPHSPKKGGYYLGKESDQRKQLSPLVFAPHGTRYYNKGNIVRTSTEYPSPIPKKWS